MLLRYSGKPVYDFMAAILHTAQVSRVGELFDRICGGVPHEFSSINWGQRIQANFLGQPVESTFNSRRNSVLKAGQVGSFNALLRVRGRPG